MGTGAEKAPAMKTGGKVAEIVRNRSRNVVEIEQREERKKENINRERKSGGGGCERSGGKKMKKKDAHLAFST